MGAANWPEVGPSAKVAAGIRAQPVNIWAWVVSVKSRSEAANGAKVQDRDGMVRMVFLLTVIQSRYFCLGNAL